MDLSHRLALFFLQLSGHLSLPFRSPESEDAGLIVSIDLQGWRIFTPFSENQGVTKK
jgi:hypothetical protein